MGGYDTLSVMPVNVGEWPEATVRKLPRPPLIPATFLGRLAVEHHHRGRGYGRFLLADALYRSLRSEIASFAVIVDAKDEAACRLCERESFLPFPDRPLPPVYCERDRHLRIAAPAGKQSSPNMNIIVKFSVHSGPFAR